MIKIGITGSLASGKSTVAKYISSSKYPLFSADKVVQKIYNRDKFISVIRKKIKIQQKKKIKNLVRKIVKQDINKLRILEKVIHPIVRKDMQSFIKSKKNKKLIFLEIPLLFESKLKKYFDVVIFVSAKRKSRIRRYIAKGGDRFFFNLLDKRQMRSEQKIKLSDYNLKNNNSLKLLKKNAKILLSKYE